MNLQTFARLSLPLIGACLLLTRGHVHAEALATGVESSPAKAVAAVEDPASQSVATVTGS